MEKRKKGSDGWECAAAISNKRKSIHPAAGFVNFFWAMIGLDARAKTRNNCTLSN